MGRDRWQDLILLAALVSCAVEEAFLLRRWGPLWILSGEKTA